MQDQDFSSRHSYNQTSALPSEVGNAAERAQMAFDSTRSLISGGSDSRGSWYRNTANEGSKENQPTLSPKITSITLLGSASVTRANTCNSNEADIYLNEISAAESRHFWMIRSSLSSSEYDFISSANLLGVDEAVYWAKRFGLDYQRPLKLLMELREAS